MDIVERTTEFSNPMNAFNANVQAELEDRLRFETLLAELSARFVNLPPDRVDQEIENALRCLVEALHVDRSTLGHLSEDRRDLVVTHSFARPGVEAFPLFPSLATAAPLMVQTLLSGQPFIMPRLVDLPTEGEADRQLFMSRQILSGMVVPLTIGGRVIGAVGCSLAHGEREWPEPVVRGMRLIADVFANALARQDADRTLRESEERMRLAAAATHIGLWVWDIPRDAIWASDRARTLYGVRADEPVNFQRLMASLHPDDRSRVETVVQSALRQGSDFREEYRILYPDGAIRWLYAIGSCRLNAGVPVRMMGASLDITERRNQEAHLRHALEEIRRLQEQLQQEIVHLRQEVKSIQGHARIIGQSPAIRQALTQVEQVAPTHSSVLLLGETGTGKELFAMAIHELSPRRDRPMVRVNCAAIPAALIESELFGREKGAYTGALARQIGRFEMANGSTIFLDEISELPLESQAKLLRVLQEKEIERLGSPKPIKVDARVIVATNRDLVKAVVEGRFREDLYYRLNVFPITVPTLRERREDVPLLVWTFVEEFSNAMGKSVATIAKSNLQALQQYQWPGNVRELRNVVERAMISASGPMLKIDLPGAAATPASRGLVTLTEAEREHIQHVLKATGGRIRGVGGAAEILGLKPTTLESRMAKLGLRRH
ncbi:MAG: sigma 54-interacting transcriptional regulator [Candidatus Competibacter sp.]|nr:sigma 54-interacting transcriptional regulator [Candidatus Competibacter sp.]MDG4583753.1 sigma 54-interacting transcriptional regulator [Candidatus Competibacter sp.]